MAEILIKENTHIGEVRLYSHTWNGHILDGHPEMDGRLDDVRNTLIDPDTIREGRKKETEKLFTREYIKHDICVSTRFMEDDYHIVTTAYTTESVSDSKGKVIWPE